MAVGVLAGFLAGTVFAGLLDWCSRRNWGRPNSQIRFQKMEFGGASTAGTVRSLSLFFLISIGLGPGGPRMGADGGGAGETWGLPPESVQPGLGFSMSGLGAQCASRCSEGLLNLVFRMLASGNCRLVPAVWPAGLYGIAIVWIGRTLSTEGPE